MRVAVVDIGTNSTRLLVSGIEDGRVRELDRRSLVTRLGRGVDLSAQLCSDAIEEVCAVLGEYIAAYEAAGAEQVNAIATSAVRDAANADAFMAELRERFALDARILDGGEEARLTYRGATWDRRPEADTLVVDIGGGSTELVLGSGVDVDSFASLQCGTVRHTERYLITDPPAASALEDLATDVHGLIETAPRFESRPVVERGIAVAGTPTSLAAIDLRLEPYDRDAVHGHRLSLSSIQRMCSELSSMTVAQRRTVTGLHPDRAPTIVAGVVILIQVMRAFSLSEIEVSENDILHGAALDAAKAAVT